MIDDNQSLKARFGARVALPVLLSLLGTVLVVGGGLYWVGRDVDKMSTEAQTYQVYHGLSVTLNELSVGQEAVARCSDCLAAITAKRPRLNWIDQNIAFKMFDLSHAAETYIIDATDRPIYAAVDRKRVAPGSIREVMPQLRPFIDRVRGLTDEQNNVDERLPDTPIPPISMATTTPLAVHSTDFAKVRGRPAIVSVMRMVQDGADARLTEGPVPLIANVRYMDDAYFAELGKQNFLHSPRIEPASNLKNLGIDEQWIDFRSSRGEPLGLLVWKPILPGAMLVGQLMPWGIGAVALLSGLLTFMAWAVWFLMRRDHDRVQSLEAAQIELKASEAQAHHLAYHDVLTGLPNRAQFTGVADVELSKARNGRKAAILLLDLDRFKIVNDRFGHLAGDRLIEEVARRLTRIAGEDNLVARLGGDEFAILVKQPDAVRQLETLIDRILHDLREPFDVLGNQAFIGVSIGVAVAPECGTDRSELLRKADIALYRAKDLGRDGCCFFTEAMDDTVQLRAALESDLRDAITSGTQLSVHYQPQMDSTGDRIVGLEALVRWTHQERGVIGPDIFVPIAEETGLIRELGDWVLSEACRTAARWPSLSVAVNLSPLQFREEGFAEHVEQLVRQAGVSPRQIELEVTEGVLLDDDDIVRAQVKGLRQKGFRIALDDFGTGYSSLSYLRKFEVDKIKIDKSFVKHLGETHDAAAIITAVVTLGHAMGLRVTAEGVETGDQSAFLCAAGCNELQGFLYSRAVPEEELPELMTRATLRQRATAAAA